MDFATRLWRGDVGLAITYWVFGVIGNYLLAIIVASIMGPTVAIVIMAASTLFVSVCIWRSATKYEGKPVWAILAKIAIVLGVLGTLKAIVT